MINVKPAVFSLTEDINRNALLTERDCEVPKEAVILKKGESLYVQPGKMAAYRNLTVSTSLNERSIWQKIKSFVLGGESLFNNKFTADQKSGWILFEEDSPQVCVAEIKPDSSGIILGENSFLASTPNVALNVSYTGITGYIKGVGIGTTLAKLKPEARYFNSCGKVYFKTGLGYIKAIKITPESPVYVDNTNIVAYTEGLKATAATVNYSATSLLFSGEGLTCKFEGEGTVYTGTGLQKIRTELLNAQHKEVGGLATAITITVVTVIGLAAIAAIAIVLTDNKPHRNPNW